MDELRERSSRSRWRQPRWWLIGALALYVMVAGVVLIMARSASLSGADELSLARAEIDIGDVLDGSATERLSVARGDFDRAQGLIDSPVLVPLRPLPIIGRQIRSGDALTGAGVDVLDLAIGAVEEMRAEIGDSAPVGAARVALLRDLEAITVEVRVALARVDLGPASGLISPLASARNELSQQLAEVEQLALDGENATRGLAELLEGPSTYLVLAANNGEMRSGSGMFLSAGIVQFENGEFILGDFEGTGDLELDAGVGAPPELERLYGWADPDREWRSLGLSPRFPVNAELASRMWAGLGRIPVDGVLSVDVTAIALILQVTGPVDVGDQVIDADNVLPVLMHDQYEVIRIRDDLNDENVARQEQLSTVAAVVIERLESPGLDLALLAENLQRAAGARHLFAWSNDPARQEVWEAVGLDGDLESNSLLVGVANKGGNKLDQYLTVSSTLEEVSREGDLMRMRLTVSAQNDAPPTDLPYVIGFDPPEALGPAGYVGFVTVSLPAAARDLSAPDENVVASGPDGPNTHAGFDFAVAAGESAEISLEFVIDTSRSTVRIEPDARIPAMVWTMPDGTTWSDSVGHTVDLAD